jgi:hypothetical protein
MPFTADAAKIGAASIFSISTDNGSTYNPVGAIIGFTPPKLTVAKVDKSAFDSPTFNSLPVEQTMAGWVNQGTFGFKLYYGKTAYAALRALVGVEGTGATSTKFKLQKSDGAGYVLTGFIAELGEEIPMKEAMTCDVMIQLTGNVATFNSTQS